VWGAFLQGVLLIGALPSAEHPLVALLAPLGSGDPAGLAALDAALRATERSLTDPASRRALIPRMADVIFCRELFGAARVSALSGGALSAAGPDRCAGGGHAFAPYDARALPISSPIYYFQGTADPASPLASARYHLDAQAGARRVFITLDGAAHGPLTLSLRALGCSAPIWDAIDREDAAALARAISACPAPLALEERAPGR
jgi:pimeloyl-ACP methyl ester carboxylesterase